MGDTPRGLIALICAYHDLEDAEGLRGTLPIAGRSLLERQGRIAAAAGAEALLVVTDPKAPAVLATAERLRRDGLQILLVNDMIEAARALEPGDRVLFMGDGALVDEDEVARVAEAEGFALLTVPDEDFDDRFERIDGDSRWAGVGLVTGQLVRHTAPMLQDWDLQSTLLRRAVQEGARQIRLSDERVPIIAETPADLATLEDALLESAAGAQRDWVSRYLLSPIEAAATRRLLGHKIVPAHLLGGAIALQAFSAASFLAGWLWPGLLLFLLSTPLIGTGERIARLMGSGRAEALLKPIIKLTGAAALLSLGAAAAALDGWGAAVLAGTCIAFMIALDGERPRRVGRGIFFADSKALGWTLLPFAAVGQWTIGLGAALVYAGSSFFVAQRRAHRSAGED